MKRQIWLGDRYINAHSAVVVAEGGQCNSGSIDTAIAMAQDAKQAGASFFKTQLLTPERIAHRSAAKYWDDEIGTENQQEAFRTAGLVDYQAWRQVKEACDEIGIEFFATPFDFQAVETLEDIGVRLYKIASGDITHRPLIEQIAATGKPIVLSTGASRIHEIESALEWIGHHDVILLACTLDYPTATQDAELGRIHTLHRKFPEYLIGYSDHTTAIITASAAISAGAVMLEKHYTTNPTGDDVPDHRMALTPKELKDYCDYARLAQTLLGEGKLIPKYEELAARQGARRSIFAKHPIRKGQIVSFSDLDFLRPGGGKSPSAYRDIVGHPAPKDVPAGGLV